MRRVTFILVSIVIFCSPVFGQEIDPELLHPDINRRRIAVVKLVDTEERALPIFEKLLHMKLPAEVRQTTYFGIAIMGKDAAPLLPVLYETYDEAFEFSNEKFLFDIFEMIGPASIPYLKKIFSNTQNEDIQKTVIYTLAELGPAVLPTLREYYEAHPHVRSAIIDCGWRYIDVDEETLATMVSLFREAKQSLKEDGSTIYDQEFYEVCYALTDQGSHVLSTLDSLIFDPDIPHNKLQIIVHGLYKFESDATPLLKKIITEHKHASLRGDAIYSLSRAGTPENVLPFLKELLTTQPHLQWNIQNGAQSFGEKGVPLLLQMYEMTPNHSDKQSILSRLANMYDLALPAIPFLTEKLTSEDKSLHEAIQNTINGIDIYQRVITWLDDNKVPKGLGRIEMLTYPTDALDELIDSNVPKDLTPTICRTSDRITELLSKKEATDGDLGATIDISTAILGALYLTKTKDICSASTEALNELYAKIHDDTQSRLSPPFLSLVPILTHRISAKSGPFLFGEYGWAYYNSLLHELNQHFGNQWPALHDDYNISNKQLLDSLFNKEGKFFDTSPSLAVGLLHTTPDPTIEIPVEKFQYSFDKDTPLRVEYSLDSDARPYEKTQLVSVARSLLTHAARYKHGLNKEDFVKAIQNAGYLMPILSEISLTDGLSFLGASTYIYYFVAPYVSTFLHSLLDTELSESDRSMYERMRKQLLLSLFLRWNEEEELFTVIHGQDERIYSQALAGLALLPFIDRGDSEPLSILDDPLSFD